MNPILPLPDAVPFSAPIWLIRVLLFVTFLVHLIAMNLLLGGGVLAAISASRGRGNVPHHRRMADSIFKLLPVVTPAAVTFGVAPLLFVQVLYGRFFYTSSILMAVPWIAVIGFLCLAYYGHYFMSLSDTIRRERFVWVPWVAAFLVLLIGFIYTNNLTLMQTPEKFKWLYVGDRTGARLNLGEPTLIPRFLHFFVASLAVAGLGIMGVGQRALRQGDPSFGPWAVRYGRTWFAGATLVQILVGLWFLLTLPETIRGAFLGGDPVRSMHLFGGIFLALVAVALALAKPESLGAFRASVALLALGILSMILVRHWVRDMMIGKLADLGAAPVRTHWDQLIVFLVLLVVALGTVVWMVRRFFTERAEESAQR
ncbi:MAG: hypothetical protein FJY88_10730 [Candidatus Eisenbacteria bacterium]|nr:hypothetical protein [Candidatus Eisenbacteria bacterium]